MHISLIQFVSFINKSLFKTGSIHYRWSINVSSFIKRLSATPYFNRMSSAVISNFNGKKLLKSIFFFYLSRPSPS